MLLHFMRRSPLRDRMLIFLFFLAAGLLYTLAHQSGEGSDALSRYSLTHPGQFYALEGRVTESSLYSPEDAYQQCVVKVMRVSSHDKALPLSGWVLLRVSHATEALFAGERVRFNATLSHYLGPTNFGLSDVEQHYRRRGIYTLARVYASGVEVCGVERWRPGYWIARLRDWEGEVLRRAVPEKALPFVLAVWLGERGKITEDTREEFTQTGTAHILAVSGIHAALIFVSIGFFLRTFMRSRRWIAIFTLSAVFLFALVAGARITTLRAAIMLALYMGADLFERESDSPTALSLAALIFLLANPQSLFQSGFLLSFSSVASLLLFSELLADSIPARFSGMRKLCTSAVSVQLLPFPLAAHFFHVLPWLAPLTNFLILPLLSIVLWLCFMTVLTALFFPSFATLLGHALALFVYLIHSIAETVAHVHGAYRLICSPTLFSMLTYWGALAVLYTLFLKKIRPALGISTMLGLLLLSVFFWNPPPVPATVNFLDVGRADAAFLCTPGGTTVLIDGGDKSEYVDMGRRVVLPFLFAHGVTHLDYVVNTHPDRDHIGGLLEVVEKLSVGMVVLGDVETEAPLELQLLTLCKARNIPVARVSKGDRLVAAGAAIDVLHPVKGEEGDNKNANSVVLRISWANAALLFTGDIEAETETMLLQEDCRADVLKVPHHGSATSSTEEFLYAVNPEIAVVSTRDTRTAPQGMAPEVTQRYEQLQIPFLRTDYYGGVRIRWSDTGYTVSAARVERGYSLVPRTCAETSPF